MQKDLWKLQINFQSWVLCWKLSKTPNRKNYNVAKYICILKLFNNNISIYFEALSLKFNNKAIFLKDLCLIIL